MITERGWIAVSSQNAISGPKKTREEAEQWAENSIQKSQVPCYICEIVAIAMYVKPPIKIVNLAYPGSVPVSKEPSYPYPYGEDSGASGLDTSEYPVPKGWDKVQT